MSIEKPQNPESNDEQRARELREIIAKATKSNEQAMQMLEQAEGKKPEIVPEVPKAKRYVAKKEMTPLQPLVPDKKEDEKIEGVSSFRDKFKTVKVMRSSGDIEDGWKLKQLGDGVAVVEKEDEKSGNTIRKVIPELELQALNPEESKPEEVRPSPEIEAPGIVARETPPEKAQKNLDNLKSKDEKKGEEIEKKESVPIVLDERLKTILPPEFYKLNDLQQLKVAQDLKRRIVDLVTSDAKTQYSEDLKNRVQENSTKRLGGLRNIGANFKSYFTKDKKIKDNEQEIFSTILEKEKDLIQEDLKLLIEKVSNQTIKEGTIKNQEGKVIPCVWYMESLEVKGTDKEQKEIKKLNADIMNFNVVANRFSRIPYEWGQERNGKNKNTYEKTKLEYDKARNKVLNIKSEENKKETQQNPEKIIQEMLEIDNAIKLDQLLSTHPEFEKALDEFNKGATNETKKAVINTLTGKNWVNRALVVGGAGARTLAKVAPWLFGAGAGAATLSTAVATPIVGGVVGGIRGRMQAKNTLAGNQKEARYGQADTSKEKVAMVDATHLTKKIEKIVDEILKINPETDSKLLNEKFALLATRLEHTQGKIEKGQVNFGNAKSSLANQFNLINTLNSALIIKEGDVLSEEQKAGKTKIDALLNKFASSISEKTSEAQKKFINKQTRRGAYVGMGFASAGYVGRYVLENVNLHWGGSGVSENNNLTGSAEGKIVYSNKGEPLYRLDENGNQVEIGETNVEPPLEEYKGGVDNPLLEKFVKGLKPIDENTTNAPAVPRVVDNFVNQGISIEHGKGGIQAIKALQEQVKIEHPDLSKAPQNIQDFVNADPNKEAIKLGFYDPSHPNAESALIQKGSILKFDSKGNLLFGKPDANGNIAELGDKYHGKMFDADKHHKIANHHHAPKTHHAPKHVNNLEHKTLPVSEEKVHIPDGENMHTPKIDTSIIKDQLPAAAADTPVLETKPTPKTSPSPEQAVPKADAKPNSAPAPKPTPTVEEARKAVVDKFEPSSVRAPSPEILTKVKDITTQNVKHLFPKDTDDVWNAVKIGKADQMIADNSPEEGLEPFVTHLRKLQILTEGKIKPISANKLLGITAETNEEYVRRAYVWLLQNKPEKFDLVKVE